MRITAAAAALGATPRMLRYRESLGLLPPAAGRSGQHRRYDDDDLAAAAWAATLEQRYDVSPAALSFALRARADPGLADDLGRLAALTGRADAARALDFDQAKALALLAGPAQPPAPTTKPRPGPVTTTGAVPSR